MYVQLYGCSVLHTLSVSTSDDYSYLLMMLVMLLVMLLTVVVILSSSMLLYATGVVVCTEDYV